MIKKMFMTMTVTNEMLADAAGLRSILGDHYRRWELAMRGFLGLVRCDRCHRPTRSVYVGRHGLFGSTCVRKAA